MADYELEQQLRDLRQSLKTALETIAILSRQIAELQNQARLHHSEFSELQERIAQLEKREALKDA